MFFFRAILVVLVAAAVARADDAALYREGFEHFQKGEYEAAGRSLSRLAPFTQEFGEQARYLLARVHELSGERPEAEGLYEAIIAFYAQSRNDRAPQYVTRSRFYSGRLMAQEGRYEEAARRLSSCIAEAEGTLKDEAKLWLGVCQVKTRKFADAVTPLKSLEGDAEAQRWLARALAGSGQMQGAIAAMRNAERVIKLDEVRLELADLLRQNRQYQAAAEVYGTIGGELAEKAQYRRAVSLALGGRLAEADAALAKFQQSYPSSARLADAALRYAEDALPAKNDDEAIRRFGEVIKKYPETTQAYLAKLGIADVNYQRGEFEKAAQVAGEIPEVERGGELAAASYLIADCMLRTVPAETPDDALGTARLMQQLQEISDRFKAFVLAHEGEAQVVDASLKMGYCQQRIAGMTADPQDRRKALSAARRMYIGMMRQFPEHPLYPIIVLESARCTMQYGGRMAENELARFQYEPLKNSPLAPLAMIRLSEAMRSTRRTEAAVKLLTTARTDYEQKLAQDPARSSWASAIRFGLGMALKEAGRYSEAEPILASMLRDYRGRPEADEANWRVAQCKRESAMEKLLPNRKFFGRRDAGERSREEVTSALDELRAAAKLMESEATAKASQPDLAAQIAWESAACWRTVAEIEVDSARAAAQEEAQRMKQRARQRLATTAPTTKPAGTQPTEAAGQKALKQARAAYEMIGKIAPDSIWADDARRALLELEHPNASQQGSLLARKRAALAPAVTRSALPPVLNLDGTSEFPRLEPFVRTSSPDLSDDEVALPDEGLLNRRLTLPEELMPLK